MLTIYHNPRCSKSRQTLALIEDNKQEFTVVEYLKTPLSEGEIQNLLNLLTVTPIEMMRIKEAEFKEQNLSDASKSEEDIIQAMVHFPKLMERPIVIYGDRAVIGRPPENVLKIIK